MYDARARSGEVNHHVREFQNGELLRISDVDWARHLGWGIHEPAEPIDQIIDVTE